MSRFGVGKVDRLPGYFDRDEDWLERGDCEEVRLEAANKAFGSCKCHDDSGDCDWCQIFYGFVEVE